MRRRLTITGAVVLAVMLVSCTKIKEFSVVPNGYVCRGQQVDISWKTSGSTELRAEPDVPGLEEGSVPQRGHRQVTIDRDTTIIISAENHFGYPLMNRQELTVLEASEPKEIGEIIECGSDDDIVVRTELTLDSRVTLSSVSLAESTERPVWIEHRGKRALVSPDNPATTAFSGIPATGEWILRSPLAEGESCPSRSLPRDLTVIATMQCSTQ